MTDEAALRAAVLAHPDDDTPRLVYADWCDDVGEADRAAFVRAQVEAARAEPWSPAQRDAEARAAAHRDQMVSEWWKALGEAYRTPEFVRGFVEGVALGLPDPVELLLRYGEIEPVRRVQFGYRWSDTDEFLRWDQDPREGIGHLERWLSHPSLGRVVGLDFRFGRLSSSVELEAIAASPHLSRLAELTLAGLPVPPDWLRRFLEGPELPALAALDLEDIPNLGPALAGGLAAARHRALTKLNVTGVHLLSRDLKRLLESPALAGVEELRLGRQARDAGPATMIDLGWLLPWSRLRLLDLAGQQLGPDGVREITDRPEAAGLRWLGLARNHLRDSGARRLLESRHLHLYHLDVTGNDISPALVAALRVRFPDALLVS